MGSGPEIMCTQYVHNKIKEFVKDKIRVWSIHDDYQMEKVDAHYRARTHCADGSPLWIEYKYIADFPKRDTTVIKPKWASALQEREVNELHDIGEKVWVVIFVGKGHNASAIIMKNGEWQDGLTCSQAKAIAVQRSNVAWQIIEKVTGGANEWAATGKQRDI